MSTHSLPPSKLYQTMQAVTPGSPFVPVSVSLKLPSRGEVLVRVLASGVCHSDLNVRHGYMTSLPRVPGHEVVGDVVAVHAEDEKEGNWKVGQRVGAGWHGGHCGARDRCRSGDLRTCEVETFNGVSRDGGYAEYVLLRSDSLASIPLDMDPAEAAPLLCAGVTVFNSLRHMVASPGDLVAVHGLGGLGHLAIQFAAKAGFEVVALSSSEAKRDWATSLGAKHYIVENQVEELTKMGGAQIMVCTSPSGGKIGKLMGGLKVGGTLLVLAFSDDITFPAAPLIVKRLSIRGWPAGTPKDMEETVQFAQLQQIATHVERFDLLDAEEAYQKSMRNEIKGRAVLVPGLKMVDGQ